MHLKLVEPLRNLLRRQPVNEMAVAKLDPGDYVVVIAKNQFSRTETEVLAGAMHRRGINSFMVRADNVDLALRIFRVESDPEELQRVQAEIEARRKNPGASLLERLVNKFNPKEPK